MNLRPTRALLLFALCGPLGCSGPSTTPATTSGAATAGSSSADGAAGAPPDPLLSAELPRDPREPLLAEGVRLMLTRQHLLQRSVDDDVSRAAFAAYLKRLDGGKLFLLKPHIDALSRYADQMDDELQRSDLVLARKGGALLNARRSLAAEMIAEILDKPFDFTVEQETETDPDKLAFCATDDELRKRWHEVIKLQALERLVRMETLQKALTEAIDKGGEAAEAAAKSLAKIPATFEEREKKVRGELAASYAGRFSRLLDADPLDPAERYLNAVTSSFDPHTSYLAPADKDNFDIDISGSLEGIGAVLGEDDHYIQVRELVPGGASWRQGDLEAGDLILAVAQSGEPPVDVGDMPIDKVVKMIRGPKGTVVELTVKKPEGRVQVISITRDVVVIEEAYARGAVIGPKGGAKVGYVLLPSFYGNTRTGATPGERNATGDVQRLLVELKKRKVAGVILDLRGNGGGLLDHAGKITGLFIETGPVVQTRSGRGERRVLEDDDPSIAYDGKVVVMVDRFSASASEIVAGALQDYRRAVVVGTSPTHGKGTVQALVELDRLRAVPVGPSLGVLKLTIEQYYRINGESTQWRGVVPDVLLPDPAAHVESRELYLDHAIPWNATDALPFELWPQATWDASALAQKSAARRASQPVFNKLGERSTLLKTLRDQTRVPLAIEAFRAKRDKESDALEAVDPELSEGDVRFEVEVIELEPAPKVDSTRKARDRVSEWRDSLARDPWVEETLHVVGDM